MIGIYGEKGSTMQSVYNSSTTLQRNTCLERWKKNCIQQKLQWDCMAQYPISNLKSTKNNEASITITKQLRDSQGLPSNSTPNKVTVLRLIAPPSGKCSSADSLPDRHHGPPLELVSDRSLEAPKWLHSFQTQPNNNANMNGPQKQHKSKANSCPSWLN